MREKTPDIPDIRDVFEKKESILKVSKKDVTFNVNMLSTKKKPNVDIFYYVASSLNPLKNNIFLMMA